MGLGKRWGKGETVRPQADPLSRPSALRLRRDCGQGLWIFEQDDGQLYIARKGLDFRPRPSELWPTDSEHPPLPSE